MKEYDAVYKSACRMCHGGCGVNVHVKDKRVVQIKGDPNSPLNRGKLCIKGLSSIENLYHSNRLKTPLKRNGKRGAGSWQSISWEEAFGIIVDQVNRIKDKHGVESKTFPLPFRPYSHSAPGDKNGGAVSGQGVHGLRCEQPDQLRQQ